MASPGLRAVGVSRLVGTMRTAERRLEDLEDGEAAADIALTEVQGAVPVVGGGLRSSARVVRFDKIPGVLVGAVYAGPINYGWPARGIEPAGFLEEAAAAAEPEIEHKLETDARRILATVKGA